MFKTKPFNLINCLVCIFPLKSFTWPKITSCCESLIPGFVVIRNLQLFANFFYNLTSYLLPNFKFLARNVIPHTCKTNFLFTHVISHRRPS